MDGSLRLLTMQIAATFHPPDDISSGRVLKLGFEPTGVNHIFVQNYT